MEVVVLELRVYVKGVWDGVVSVVRLEIEIQVT